jgi:hypothetical protein
VKASDLWVFTARFNPLRWETPDRHFRDWCTQMLDHGVNVVVGEVQYGERPFVFEDFSPHVKHVGLRASSPAWCKENVLNILVHRTPQANYICWQDADVFWEKPSWAAETVEALQLYKIIQPWHQAIDRGPHGEILSVFSSFCHQYEAGEPLIPDRHGWKSYGHDYPHPGFCWASTRQVLDHTGGLFEYGGMGAADHAMALALVGKAYAAAPKMINQRYVEHLERWQAQIRHAVHGRIGYAHNVINHRFHGRKVDRKYLGRWEMFLKHGFDPDYHLKRNLHGVLEWAGTSARLERDWMLYLRDRREDANESE